jgi:hypothetical protein
MQNKDALLYQVNPNVKGPLAISVCILVTFYT